MFKKRKQQKHQRTGSASTTLSAAAAPPPLSPLRFDFDDLPPPRIPGIDGIRPSTSDGLGVSRSSVSLAPPVLPPIARVTSGREMAELDGSGGLGLDFGGDDSVEESKLEEQDAAIPREERPEPPRELKDLSPQSAKETSPRPATSAGSTPRMEPSLFPSRNSSVPLLSSETKAESTPPMTREWIDARDKPYGPPPARPTLQANHSSPDLTSMLAQQAGLAGKSALAANSSNARPPLTSSNTSPDLSLFQRPPSHSSMSARPWRSSKTSKITTIDAPARTLGTSYQETSPSFPPPQHELRRPQTSGPLGNLGGHAFPTHYSSTPKPEKRKTRLLNPLHLLSRRRSGQNEETLATEKAHAQSLQKQKTVAEVGVNKLPEDFDPRIKGKVVHDFSAPREARRMFSYNDALDPWGTQRQLQSQLRDGMQSSSSAPFIPAIQEQEARANSPHSNKHPSDGSSSNGGGVRRSMGPHTAMFKEHLSEVSSGAGRVHAERLENKDFLQRASRQSVASQESAILPPFARRSQHVDPSHASQLNDDNLSKRSSTEPSRHGGDRDSHVSRSSASSGISPITQRGSTMPFEVARESMSPVSPSSPTKRDSKRPTSEHSRLGSNEDVRRPISDMSVKTLNTVDSSSRPWSTAPPAVEPIAEESDRTPRLGDGIMPMPERAPPQAPAVASTNSSGAVSPSLEIPPRLSSAGGSNGSSLVPTPRIPSNEPTPQPSQAQAAIFAAPKSPPKLVEKRASAVGHAKRASASLPKHRVSNASRFSFQFGGSTSEESALEEKARKLGGNGETRRSPENEEEEDEDDFDEDAMDDMDEMEVSQQDDDDNADDVVAPLRKKSTISSAAHQFLYRPASTFMPMANARKQLQPDDVDDGDDDYNGSEGGLSDEEEAPYWMHDDFAEYAESRKPSTAADEPLPANNTKGSSQGPHKRNVSDAHSSLSVDTNVADQARTGFYMQLRATGHVNGVPTPAQEDASMHKATFSSSTNGNGYGSREIADSGFPDTTAYDKRLPTLSNGLGLSDFGDFKFHDSPDPSRPTSLLPGQMAERNHWRGDSETIPQGTFWSAGGSAKSSPMQHARSWSKSGQSDHVVSPLSPQLAAEAKARAASAAAKYNMPFSSGDDEEDDDDMYFHDDGFEADVNTKPRDLGESLNEDAFDDPNFLSRANGAHAVQPRRSDHERDSKAFSMASLGGDGPYPSFAMPNASKARQRDSRLMLEDLPLQAPVDAKFLPQRNPSEDAKRLGLSNKVPPLPAQGTSQDAIDRTLAQLQAYHAALADAATKAASDGRFMRLPSTSTSRSLSQYSKAGQEEAGQASRDDRSFYSQNGASNAAVSDAEQPNGDFLESTDAVNVNAGKSIGYSPGKMNFDFGFDSDSAPVDDSIMDDEFEGYDDIISEANQEALANDDDGFYGQEFGFYANARPNSGEIQAINGGFFGLDGDDGLMRQKSLKEPNLTPITERSEFSTRNSFIGLGHHGQFGPFSPASRLPLSPWSPDGEITTFEQLRKLRGHAFGASNGSLHSDGKGGFQPSSASPNVTNGYFSGAPMTFASSTDSSASSNPSSAHPLTQQGLQPQSGPHQDSPYSAGPHSAASSGHLPFSMDPDATPKRPLHSAGNAEAPLTARKVSGNKGHSRNSSGADSVTYVREQDPDDGGPPRWVLEKRRTSEQGQLELVAREILHGGWI